MQVEVPYKNLTHTLECLKLQVIDSLPYIAEYVPSSISTPEELFYFWKDRIIYKKDPKGVELLQTVQTLMKNGGHGDCDCFTILTLTSCIYLNFYPQAVRIVGMKKSGPSHIYSMVWDEDREKMCAMDLTNPEYCQERKYNYKQTLDFMILSLQDDGLSSRASRRARREERHEQRQEKREQKHERHESRQHRRTERVKTKEQRKATKRKRKLMRQGKKLMRVTNKQQRINARHQKKMNRIAASQPQYSPDSDSLPEQDEQMQPGSQYQASEATQDIDYELMPEDDQQQGEVDFDQDDQGAEDGGDFEGSEDMDEMQDYYPMSAGIVGGALKGIKDIYEAEKKKAAPTVKKIAPKKDDTNEMLKLGGAALGGALVGFTISRIFK